MNQTILEQVSRLWPIYSKSQAPPNVPRLLRILKYSITSELKHGASLEEIYETLQDCNLIFTTFETFSKEAYSKFKPYIFTQRVPFAPNPQGLHKRENRFNNHSPHKHLDELIKPPEQLAGQQEMFMESVTAPDELAALLRKREAINERLLVIQAQERIQRRKTELAETQHRLRTYLGSRYQQAVHPFQMPTVMNLLRHLDVASPQGFPVLTYYLPLVKGYLPYLLIENLLHQDGQVGRVLVQCYVGIGDSIGLPTEIDSKNALIVRKAEQVARFDQFLNESFDPHKVVYGN